MTVRFLPMPQIAALSAALLLCTPYSLQADDPTEFFDHPAFLARAGVLRVIDFDSKPPGDNAIAENEYLSRGLRIVQRAGLGINVVQNIIPGGYGANFVTAANINSAPNAISTSIGASSASPSPPDKFDFILTSSAKAAGLFVGNLGALGNQSTLIEFLDAEGNTIASESVDGTHLGVINGSLGVNFDNRIFYGIVSETPVKTIRVTNPPDDGDGIVIDDVQFSVSAPLSIAIVGSEVRISWPSDITNYQLHSATQLSGDPCPWQPVATPPVLSGNEWQVTKPKDSPREFFRLGGKP